MVTRFKLPCVELLFVILVPFLGFAQNNPLNFDRTDDQVSETTLSGVVNTFIYEFLACQTKIIIIPSESASFVTSANEQQCEIFPDLVDTPGNATTGVSVGDNAICVFEKTDY